ncbi:MAG: hypothetical protein ACI8U4_000601, partial [Natronomonas sp.]
VTRAYGPRTYIAAHSAAHVARRPKGARAPGQFVL